MNNTLETEFEADSSLTSIIAFLISIPLIILIVIGNSFVIFAWILRKSLRTPQNVYYVSLAIADLLVGIIVLPLALSYMDNEGWVYGQPLCKAWLVTSFSLNPITAYHLVAIAVDRYRTLTEGVTYLQRHTVKSATEICVIMWLLGVWVPIVLVLDWNNVAMDPENPKECITLKTPFWVMHIALSALVFPGYLISRIYYKVFFEIQKKMKARQTMRSAMPSCDFDALPNDCFSTVSDTGEGDQKSHLPDLASNEIEKVISKKRHRVSLRGEKRTAKTLMIIVGAFFLCWIPWYGLIFCEMFNLLKPLPFISTLLLRLGNANSFMNPIIYAFRNSDFKKAFKEMLVGGFQNTVTCVTSPSHWILGLCTKNKK